MMAEPWPEADRLFRSDPRWMGSDDAYSVPLGNGKTLWLFGDTFVADGPGKSRHDCTFVHNTVGVQSGEDPSRATMSFHWGSNGGRATSFFELDGDEWLWPLDGRLIDGSLLLFFMRVRPTSRSGGSPIDQWREMGSLGFFDVQDFMVARVPNPDASPDRWETQRMEHAYLTHGIVTGASLLMEDDHLLAYGWRGRDGFLCRWEAAKASSGELGSPEWWDGEGWADEADRAAAVLTGCTTEFTVHRDPAGRIVQIQLDGVGNGSIEMRTANRPQGPFGDPQPLYDPPETTRPGVIAYAAKAHPQLSGSDLVCTYASIADVDETLEDDNLYYPRFVRIWQQGRRA